jgi:hypothetical protein
MAMSNPTTFNRRHFITVLSLAILVGTEIIGVALAAGWAIAGLTGLGPTVSYVLMGLLSVIGAYALVVFIKQAVRIEPINN